MSMELLVSTILLVGLLGVAVVSDLRRHRIPNTLVLLGLALGLAGQVYTGGLGGLGDSLLGMLICFGLFLPMYAVGGMAAGDVKLMTMVGSFLPFHYALWAALFSLIAGGVRFPDCPGPGPTAPDPGALLADCASPVLSGADFR